MGSPATARQRKARAIAALIAVSCIFGLMAAYQPTPMADRSNEPLSETAAILARREGARVGREAAKSNVAGIEEEMKFIAAERASQTAFQGSKRSEWRSLFLAGFSDAWLEERHAQLEKRK
jgi:hypothetical protein